MTTADPTTIQPPAVSRRRLQRFLGISSDTMRRWIDAKKLPPFDIYVSDSACWWRVDTLERAGFKIRPHLEAEAASSPTPAASTA